MTSYENLLAKIGSIPAGNAGNDRTITWFTNSQTVGMARNNRGHLELFLAGDPLESSTLTLKSAMQHHSWHRHNQGPLNANRILLPAMGHYDQVGAFISAELLRENADANLKRAFAVCEPLIELAIKRLEISESAILGLTGELVILEALCRRVSDVQVAAMVRAWDGWRRSARDFAWESTGIEVKTTTRNASSHVIRGIHQVEPSPASDDESGEANLLLVSVGLRQAEDGVPFVSIPTLVDRVLRRLDESGSAGAAGDFLTRVSNYGSEHGFGYDHASMANEAPFTMPFSLTFVRGYDMSDPGIEVIRRHDVVSHHHIDIQSLAFRAELPAFLNSSNPLVGIDRVAEAVLGVSS